MNHTVVKWSTTKAKVQTHIAELRKWRYDRKSSAVTNNLSREGYEAMTPLLTDSVPANTSVLVELTDAISNSYAEGTARLKDLHDQLIAAKCSEKDWNIIHNQIKFIISERKFLDDLFIDGNGVEGSSWYRKTGWNITTSSALKNRVGVITCPFVIAGDTLGVSIVSWRVKLLDMGRMFITPYFAKDIRAEIPSNLGDLEYIEELSFCYNFLMGIIPDTICKLKKLRILKLEANQLSGPIPVGFGKSLTKLEELYLDHNRLEGSIDELLDLPVIKKIHIHENKFYGVMKDAFLNKGIEEFHFYYNYLELSDKILKRCDGNKWDGRKEKEKPMRVVKDSN